MNGISPIGAAHIAMGSVALVSAIVSMLPNGTVRHDVRQDLRHLPNDRHPPQVQAGFESPA